MIEPGPTRLIEVAVPAFLDRPLTYALSGPGAERGCRVIVPLQKRPVIGVIVAVKDASEAPQDIKLKQAIGVLHEPRAFNETRLSFIESASTYYLYPLGMALSAAAPPIERSALEPYADALGHREVLRRSSRPPPPALEVASDAPAKLGRAQRRLFEIIKAQPGIALPDALTRSSTSRQQLRRLLDAGLVRTAAPTLAPPPNTPRPNLNAEQRAALQVAQEAANAESPPPVLLQGVTGSGKTAVYLEAARQVLAQGRAVIILVPEIALTPMLIERVRDALQEPMAVFHSHVNAAERLAAHIALRDGHCRVAVGARSALFAAVDALGLVVVDEEHDTSYKQQEGFHYHARDMAMLLAKQSKAACILASATPSLDTLRRVQEGRIRRCRLDHRPDNRPMPEIQVVDRRRAPSGPRGIRWMSPELERAIQANLENNEQTLLLLNRRGFAPILLCEACGHTETCPNCSVALTLHADGRLRCHYCTFHKPRPQRCTACQHESLRAPGLGTQRLEQDLNSAFPDARVLRLDRDIAHRRGAVESVLTQFRAGKADIMVGTQMLAKGHDLPQVTLVGIVLADTALHIPDFRSTEWAFQLFVQVAGRAGRHALPGRVLLQTYEPAHPVWRAVSQHAVDAFATQELEQRKALGYPPSAHAALIRCTGREQSAALATTESAHRCLRQSSTAKHLEIRGPAEAPKPRLNNRFHFQLLVMADARRPLRQALREMQAKLGRMPQGVRLTVDIDPISLA